MKTIFAIAAAVAACVMFGGGANADPLPYGPDTCASGYVWRDAAPNDHVCVTPADRSAAAAQNAAGPSHLSPTGGASGPNTCLAGYVWREAFGGDVVCVTPAERADASRGRRDRRTRARQ